MQRTRGSLRHRSGTNRTAEDGSSQEIHDLRTVVKKLLTPNIYFPRRLCDYTGVTKADYIYYRRLRDELRRAILALSANPAASTTISTGDGQKSVTYKSLNALQAQLSVA